MLPPHIFQSTGASILGTLKDPKFFLQFQIARVQTAQGQTLSVAASVSHQLTKVLAVRDFRLARCFLPTAFLGYPFRLISGLISLAHMHPNILILKTDRFVVRFV